MSVTKAQAEEALKTLTAFVTGEAAEESASVSIPTPEEFESYDKDQIAELTTALGLNVEGQRASVVKATVGALVNIIADVEVEKEDADAVAEALGLTPDKKLAKTLAAIKEWASSLSDGATAEESSEESAEEGTEEATEEGSEETAEEGAEESTEEAGEGAAEEGSEESSEEDTSDGVDRAAVAKTFKDFPDEEEMTERIEAYNAAVEDEYHLKGKTTKDKYRNLVAELVDSEGSVSEWGTAYARDGQGYSCGLPLQDNDAPEGSGKCAITEKIFVLNEDQTGFVEHVEKKKAAPKPAAKPAAKPVAKKK